MIVSAVPEVAVEKDREAMADEGNIRRAFRGAVVFAIAIPERIEFGAQHANYPQLKPGIAAANPPSVGFAGSLT